MAPQPVPPASKTKLEDVRAFLQQLHEKMAIKRPFSLVFKDGQSEHDSRNKNRRALPHLEELGISPDAGRRSIIESLVATDYCEGPVANYDPHPNPGDLWVFGKYIKGEPYYIKMQMGHLNRSCICVSFHPPSSPLRFPFQR
ncbi:MAG: hypothetical protein EOO61_17725 [Hymenobacter sp.]|nr:MAG: hypothetical protein EOO61_17725 [Hymenobacter sp.]